MGGSVSPGRAGRKRVMEVYRTHPADPGVRRRTRIVLLRANRWNWPTIASALYCSSRMMDRCKKRLMADGLDALTEKCRQTAA